MGILTWLVLSSLGALLYRVGGTSQGTKWRDLGLPIILTVYLLALGIRVPIWAFMLSFGLLFGALTTYFNLDEAKYGFFAHGLAVALSALPIIVFTGHWLGFAIRTIVLTAFITIWSEKIEDVNWEEGMRGFAIIATTPLLLI